MKLTMTTLELRNALTRYVTEKMCVDADFLDMPRIEVLGAEWDFTNEEDDAVVFEWDE